MTTRIEKDSMGEMPVPAEAYYGAQTARLWWQPIAAKLARFGNLSVFAVSPDEVKQLGRLAQRSMRLQATVQDGRVLFSGSDGEADVEVEILQSPG